jgi:hypothetical protein
MTRTITIGLALVLGSLASRGADITYYVDQTIGAGSVTGDIVTDGTTGTLFSANIVSWNLELNDGTATFDLSGPTSESVVSVDGTDLSATLTELLFNFGGSDSGFLDFVHLGGVGFDGVCFAAVANCQTFDGHGEGIGESILIYPDNPQFTAESGPGAIATTPEPNLTLLLVPGFALALTLRKRRWAPALHADPVPPEGRGGATGNRSATAPPVPRTGIARSPSLFCSSSPTPDKSTESPG